MKSIVIIPARMGSTRLPNKPLADINGVPMVIKVAQKAKLAGFSDILIAAAEPEIAQAAEKYGYFSVLTDPNLPSGTDRIHQALQKFDKNAEYDLIINLQGDIPLVEPELIKAVENFARHNSFDIATAATIIESDADKHNPNIVKVVGAWNESETQAKALYFTRATAPTGVKNLYHHIGLYVYKKSALEKFVSLSPSPLELAEKLEQLRALENNMTIGVIATKYCPLGVDTPEDLEKVRNIDIKTKNNG